MSFISALDIIVVIKSGVGYQTNSLSNAFACITRILSKLLELFVSGNMPRIGLDVTDE